MTRNTGGIFYHYLAWRFRQTLWRSYLVHIRNWYENLWRSGGNRLLLIGPSAGYSIPNSFLNRWSHVVAIDIDPWAPKLFHITQRGLKGSFDWHKQDLFFSDQGQFDPRFFVSELHRLNCSHVIFCNILGQLPVRAPEQRAHITRWFRNLPDQLKTHHWASYHDVVSVKEDCHTRITNKLVTQVRTSSAEDLIRRFFPENLQGSQFTDHETLLIPYEGTVQYFGWQLGPRRYHVIEVIESEG